MWAVGAWGCSAEAAELPQHGVGKTETAVVIDLGRVLGRFGV